MSILRWVARLDGAGEAGTIAGEAGTISVTRAADQTEGGARALSAWAVSVGGLGAVRQAFRL